MNRTDTTEEDMHRLSLLLVALLIPAMNRAQTEPPPMAPPPAVRITIDGTHLAYAPEPGAMLERPRTAEPPDDRDDPAYAAYKQGYTLILDERWEAARKKFAEMLAKYRQSRYRVDAEYWSAYALKHLDRKKAIRAYEEFLRQHSRSTYLDDVVADIAELRARATIAPDDSAKSTALRDLMSSLPQVAPTPAPGVSHYSMSIRRLERAMHHQFFWGGMGGMSPELFAETMEADRKPLDRRTRLKIQAIRALGEIPDDPKSFSTLKDIALDPGEPRPLRSVALSSLARFKNPDLIPVLVRVAEHDTDVTVQGSAVYCIASTAPDKDTTIDILSQVYEKTPADRTRQRQTILYVIGTVGSDRAVTFLAHVARTSENPEISLTAIDGIGEAGKDKNTVVETLVSLYRETPQKKTDLRETILYTVADVGNDRAVDFLGDVALNDPDYDARDNAVSLLGNIGGERARNVLYRVLKGQ